MLSIPLINCELNLVLMWSANCVITSMTEQEVTAAQRNNLAVFDQSPTSTILAIADAKIHVPVITLLIQDDNKLLQ